MSTTVAPVMESQNMVPFNSDNSGVSMRVTAVIFLVNLWLSAAQQCNEKFNIPKFSFDGYKFKCEVKMVYDDIEFDFERYLTFIFSI